MPKLGPTRNSFMDASPCSAAGKCAAAARTMMEPMLFREKVLIVVSWVAGLGLRHFNHTVVTSARPGRRRGLGGAGVNTLGTAGRRAAERRGGDPICEK